MFVWILFYDLPNEYYWSKKVGTNLLNLFAFLRRTVALSALAVPRGFTRVNSVIVLFILDKCIIQHSNNKALLKKYREEK